MLRTRRLRNELRTAATSSVGRASRGQLAVGTASPLIVAQVVHRLEDLTSELDLGDWQRRAAARESATGMVRDD